ncbi:hypothetical protein P389DRAFT_85384 [Cystobasidium minutum MCA 4210]|uniref:uncharacterized protein n=1 Tax=Cystobasidium minutum MCA 4210 TaxID=1397322 RepID=UPI0034CE2116|eukprot:jgi/Rhomi1/85384/CE85383_324
MASGRAHHVKTKEQIDRALAEKELGAAAFKAGDYTGALKKYHLVIIFLKGIASQQSFRDLKPNTSLTETEDESDQDDEDGEDGEEAGTEKDKSRRTTQNRKPSKANTVDDVYTYANVKKTMAACYVNMAICHSKDNAWAKCKRAAESALQVDKDNFKAKFRVAQATVRLGEIAEGRRKLEDLLKEQDDAAIRNELKVLQAAEAVRDKKHKESFKGFLSKGFPDTSPSKQTNGQSSVNGSTIIPPDQPRFTEITEDDTSTVQDTPAKGKEREPVLPPTPPKSE